MIDFIILLFLCRNIGKLSREKGLSPILWQLLTVIGWIVFEGIGLNIALGWYGYNDINNFEKLFAIIIKQPEIFFFSLFSAFGGYLLVRFILEQKQPKDNIS